MSNLESEATALRTQRDEAAAAVERAEKDQAHFRNVEVELAKLINEFEDLSQRKRDVEERRQRLMTQADPLSASQNLPNTLSGINNVLRNKTEEKEKVAEDVMTIKDDQLKMMRLLSELEGQARSCMEELEQLEGVAKKMGGLEERRESLKSSLARLDTSRAGLRKEIQPLQSRLKESQGTMDRMTSNWKQQEKELRSDLDDATKDATELMRLHEVAKQATGAGTKQALEQAIARNDDLQRKIDTYVEKIKDIHDQINQAEQQVAELESVKNTILCSIDCLQYKQQINTLEAELKNMRAAIQNAEKEVKGCAGEGSTISFSQCEKKKLELEMAKSENRGKMETTTRQLKEIQDRLASKQYKSIKVGASAMASLKFSSMIQIV